MNSAEKIPKTKTANLLSVCIKAGKTAKGFDSVCEAVKSGKAFCVLTSCDTSEKTLKEVYFICKKYSVPVLETELTKEDTARICGKNTAVFAVCDKNFAEGFMKIAENKPSGK